MKFFSLEETGRRRAGLLKTKQFLLYGGDKAGPWLRLEHTEYILEIGSGKWKTRNSEYSSKAYPPGCRRSYTLYNTVSFEEVFESLPKERQKALALHLDLLLEKP